jgi:hypothetical protein
VTRIRESEMWSLRYVTRLLIVLVTISRSYAYIMSPIRFKSSHSASHSLQKLYGSSDSDDDRPKLEMREESDGPKVSVRSIEEVKKGPSSTPSYTPREVTTKKPKSNVSFGKGVFGSMRVEDLKSKGFVREGVQKVGFVAKKEDLNGIQPMTPLTFSILPAGMSYVFWQITTYMTGESEVRCRVRIRVRIRF